MGDTERYCFVCYDEHEPLLRVCACHTLVHAHCFSRLVNEVEAHELGCPVCKTAYEPILFTTRQSVFAGLLCSVSLFTLLGVTLGVSAVCLMIILFAWVTLHMLLKYENFNYQTQYPVFDRT